MVTSGSSEKGAQDRGPRWGYEEVQRSFQQLLEKFALRERTLADIHDIERLLIALDEERDCPMNGAVYNAGAAITRLCVVDLDSDGHDEVVLVNNHGNVQLLQFGQDLDVRGRLETGEPLRKNVTDVLGFLKHQDPMGYTAGLLVADSPALRYYLNVFLQDDYSAVKLFRRPPQIARPIALVPVRAGSPRSVGTVEVLLETSETQQVSVLRAVGVDTPQFRGTAEYRSPFQIRAVLYDDQGILAAGTRSRVLYFPFSAIEDGRLIADETYEARLSGYVTALAESPERGGQRFLAACEDGWIFSLDRQTGRIAWKRRMPAPVLALDSGDVDGDGNRELIAGCLDGSLAVWEIVGDPNAARIIERSIQTARDWALQVEPKPQLVARWQSTDVPVLRRLAQELRPARDSLETLRLPHLHTQLEMNLLWRKPAPGVLETFHTAFCPETGKTWLLTATKAGKLLLYDASVRDPIDRLDLGSAGPVRAIVSEPVIDRAHPELAVLTADGTVRVYYPAEGFDLRQPKFTWETPGEAWSMAFQRKSGGQLTAITGNGRGWLESAEISQGSARQKQGGLLNKCSAHHLALFNDPDGCVRLAASDGQNLGLTIAPLDDLSQAEEIPLNQVVTGLLAWPAAGIGSAGIGRADKSSADPGSVYRVAVCSNQEVFIFNQWNELIDRHYPDEPGPYDQLEDGPGGSPRAHQVAATIFPYETYDEAPVLLTATGSRVVIYRRSGERLAELHLGINVSMLRGFYWAKANGKQSAGLAAVTADGEIYLFEVPGFPIGEEQNGSQPRWAEEVNTALSLPEVVSAYRQQAKACQLIADLGAMAQAGGSLGDWASRQAANPQTFHHLPRRFRTCYVESLVNLLTCVSSSYREPIAGVLAEIIANAGQGAAYDRRILMRMDKQVEQILSGPPGKAWILILDQLADSQDTITLRGVTRMALTALGKENPDAHWWDLLRKITGQGDRPVACETIALHLRSLHQPKPSRAWRAAHQYLEHGMHPNVLGGLSGDTIPLIIREPRLQKLYAALADFMTSSSARKLDALAALVETLDEQESWVEHDQLAGAYRGLQRLANASDERAVRNEIEGPWVAQVMDQLKNSGEGGQLDLLSQAIQESLELVRYGLEEYGLAPFEKKLELLNDLVERIKRQAESDLQTAENERLQQHYTTANWLECLGLLMRSWQDESGWLGQWINKLRFKFLWEVEITKARMQEGEILADFEIKNIGFATAFDLIVRPVELVVGSEVVPCQFSLVDESKITALRSGERISGSLRASLPKGLSRGSDMRSPEQVRVRFTLMQARGQEGKQPETKEKQLSISGRREQIDYPNEFASSFKLYLRRMRNILARKGGLIFVELDRSARPSFFQAILAQLPAGQGRVVNLRKIFQQVKNERMLGGAELQISAEDLISRMAMEITGSDEEISFGLTYRSQFSQLLLGGPRPVDKLFLDQFDDLLQRLMEEKDGGKTLSDILDCLVDLSEENQIQVVLGGSYLSYKILRATQPAFAARLESIRPDLLQFGGSGQEEILRFLEREFHLRGLERVFMLFSQPVGLVDLAGMCGGNLSYLRFFLLDGLEQAVREAEKQSEAARYKQITATTYLLEYARQQNFFRAIWAWQTFYEKIGLALLAEAQFTVNKKDWLSDVEGLRLSQPYHPGMPPDHRTGERRYSSKTEGLTGQVIDGDLIAKIRSSKYFSNEDVWVAGFATRSALSNERSRAGLMLWRLLRATCLDQLLEQFEEEGITERHAGSRELGDIFTFRVPLFREFLERSAIYERMVGVANGIEKGGWYPESLYMDTAQPAESQGRIAKITPVYHQIAVMDLPALYPTFREPEDLDLFLNFYGWKGNTEQRRRRWDKAVSLARAMKNLSENYEQAGEDETRKVFETLNDLLDVRRVAFLPGLQTGPARKDIGSEWTAWQYTQMGGGVFIGLNKNVLISVVTDGSRWSLPEVQSLCGWAHEYLQAAVQAEQSSAEDENGNGSSGKNKHKDRSVIVLIAMQNASVLGQHVRQVTRHMEDRYVVLGNPELGELVQAEIPAEQLVQLVRNQIGRSPFSPYKWRGPLEPGSQLFVGRKNEVTRILNGIGRSTYLILGSRRIGKTSLLREVENQLKNNPDYITLWMGISINHEAFFERARSVLEKAGSPEIAHLIGEGPATYEGLRQALIALRARTNRMPVLLLDEVDNLYRADRARQEQLFSLLRDMTQETPPVCRLIMTGYRQVYLYQFVHGSVFFNFGEQIFLREVEDRDLLHLIELLKNYGAELYHPKEASDLILNRTYGIPYLVQTACDALLERLDKHTNRENRDRVEREDIYAVLKSVDEDLFKELISEMRIDAENEAQQQEIRFRLRIVLFSIVLSKYPNIQDAGVSFRPLSEKDRFFTAADVVEYLDTWAYEAREFWNWNHEEMLGLLKEAQMTMAVALDNTESETRFYFPREILPRLLYNYYQGGRHGHIINSLEDTIRSYLVWMKAPNR